MILLLAATGCMVAQGCADDQPVAPGDRAGRAMARFDRNGDGFVSPGEAAAEPRLATRFSQIDADGDGRISEAEARFAAQRIGQRNASPGGAVAQPGSSVVPMSAGEAARAPTPSAGRGGGAGAFAQMDANGNGILTRDEVTGRFAEKFDLVDTNGDGFVTREEVESALSRRTAGGGGTSRRTTASTAGGGSVAPVEHAETTLLDPSGLPLPTNDDRLPETLPEALPESSGVTLQTDEEGFLVPVPQP